MKITLSKSQWQLIGAKTGWIKEAQYLVVNNDFNKENYPNLVGKTFDSPPPYAQVVLDKDYNKWILEASDFLDKAEKMTLLLNLSDMTKKIQDLNNELLDRRIRKK